MAAGLCATLLLGVASAQTSSSTEMKTFEVVAVSGNHVVAKGSDGVTKEYNLPPGFQVEMDGKMIPVSDLKAGMTVHAKITTKTSTHRVITNEVKNGEVMNVTAYSLAALKTGHPFTGPRTSPASLSLQSLEAYACRDLEGRHIHRSSHPSADDRDRKRIQASAAAAKKRPPRGGRTAAESSHPAGRLARSTSFKTASPALVALVGFGPGAGLTVGASPPARLVPRISSAPASASLGGSGVRGDQKIILTTRSIGSQNMVNSRGATGEREEHEVEDVVWVNGT